jgi:fumarate hydratase subunit beta
MKLTTPLTQQQLASLKANDILSLSGTIYTARDAAHKRLIQDIKDNKALPFDLNNQIIYYVGPSPTPPNQTFGSAGPTTASRMDPYTLTLLEHGLKGVIAKGYRSPEVQQAFLDHQAVYLLAIGGAGALLGNCVVCSKIIAYEELGAEAIHKLEVKDFPVIVAYDIYGNNAYNKK